VQLPEKLIIYTVNNEDPTDMKYKAYRKISKKLECNHLLVLAHHLVICLNQKIQLMNFSGVIEREWILDSAINYMKVIGGPPKKEGLIVGLKDGSIFKVFVDNAFPILLIKQSTSIKSVDINASREKVAVVNDFQNMFIYDSVTKKLLHQETNAESVCWNLEMDEMLAYTGEGHLFIKTGDLPPSTQRMPGEVVGFKGSKIFTLFDGAMTAIDVPQSGTFYQFLQNNNFDMAYKIACLGVTEQDWRSLGIEALKNFDFEMAKKAFIRIRDLKFLELCERSFAQYKRKDIDKVALEAEIMCYLGKFKEACLLYTKNNLAKSAIEMYTLLRKFKEAEEIAAKHGGGKINFMSDDLLLSQAQHEEDNGNWKEAANLYVKCKHYKEAINVYGKKGALDSILKILTKEPNQEEIMLCIKYFKEYNHHTYAKQAILKLNDMKALMALHIEFHQWDEALQLLKTNPQFADKVYLPYADWLASNDRFEEAQEAYKKAKKPDLAMRIIEFLCRNAVIEKRFRDAAKYFFILA